MNDGAGICCRPEPIVAKVGEKVSLRLMSDLHIGASNVDYNLINEELEDARKNNSRISLNGDVFDLILPKDHKRFTPDVLHPQLLGRRDVINEAVKMAVKILKPYADLIDMIGVGNHETAVEKYHSADVTMMLIEELQRHTKHRIHYGSYLGFLDYRLKLKQATTIRGSRFVVFYYHGGGGSAPVTKGMIDFNRLQVMTQDADVIWIGHKHNRIASHIQTIRCPDAGDVPQMKDVLHVMTGAYYDTYQGQSQDSIWANGRRSNYAADSAMAPQGKGGWRIDLEMSRISFKPRLVG